MSAENGSFLADRLIEERERLGLSQTDFGRLGGVGKTTQINYEQSSTSPTATYLIALNAAGVDAVYVLTGHRAQGETESLNPDEAELIGYYRACDKENRSAARVVLRGLARDSSLGAPPGGPQNRAALDLHDAAEDEAIQRYAASLPEPPMMQRMTMGRHKGGKR